MGNFFIGLCLGILGVGIYQFSHLFNLYPAQGKKEIPWPYLVLLISSWILIAVGAVTMLISLF